MQIGVCDDQKEVREMVMEKIKEIYPAGEVKPFQSGQEVLGAVRLPDILFLDIQMPGLDGMQAAKELRKRSRQVIIVFLTVTEDYVFQSFDVGAFHYLVKPFADEKFAQVLQNAVRQIEAREQGGCSKKKEAPSLMVTSKGEHISVPLEEIVYAEIFNRKIIIHTMDADIEYYGKMKELEKIAGEDFYRPHRAYLVNFNFVRKYNGAAIYLKKGQALMAKQNYQDFVKRYLRFNQKKGKG